MDWKRRSLLSLESLRSRQSGTLSDPAKPIRAQIANLEREKAKAAELALTVDDSSSFTRLISERTNQISALRAELSAVEGDQALSEAVRALTPARLRELLMEFGGPDEALARLAEKVVLEPNLTCQVHYRAAWCLSMASPRGFEPLSPP